MHVFRCLDDALFSLRNTLLDLRLSHPVLIKIVDEAAGGQELLVFKIERDSASTDDELHHAVQDADNTCAAMEVDDNRSSSKSNSDSSAVPAVIDEDEMAASMLQLADAPGNRAGDEAREVEDDDVAAAPTTTSDSDEGDSSRDSDAPTPSRKSDRQKGPVNHLGCVPSSSSVVSKKKRKIGAASPCATSRTVKQQKRVDCKADNESDEMQIAALSNQLKEAYDRRATVVADAMSPSKVLELFRQVLTRSVAENAPLLLQQCATHVTSLITTSSAQKMVGYYLRSILAHHLKLSSRRQYSRLARVLLGIKSSTDIAAYPAFFAFVQRHCPSVAAATAEKHVNEEVMSQWLTEPLFIADIGWTEWRRYLSKTHLHIADTAVESFIASIESFQDWMQLGWVEIYDDDKLGSQGVRASRDIHLPKTKPARRDVRASISVVAADLHCAGPEFVKMKDPAENPEYLIQMDKECVFDARHHWIGKINHVPMPHCNLKVTQNGKLVQIKPITAGDALTWDYGMDYWVYQVTGLDVSDWLSEGGRECQRGRTELFTRMHESVLDYSGLLQKRWASTLLNVSSAVARESVLIDLEEYVDANV